MHRRSVLRTGIRLAYAAPVIVATVHLAQEQALACSPAIACGPCERCSDVEGCVPIPGCVVD